MTPARVCAFLPVLAALAASAATAITPAAAVEPFAHVPSYFTMNLLSLPQGSRNFAMGRTGVADDASPSNVFYNPANIAFYDRVYWNANYLDWPLDIDLFDIGVFGGHAFQLSGDRAVYVATAVRYSRMDVDIDSWPMFLPEGANGYPDFTESAIPISIAAGFSTRHIEIGVGSTVKFVSSEVGDETFDATGIDVGATARTSITPWDNAELSLALGASAINLGNGPTYGSLKSDFPLEYHVGLGVGLAGYSGDSRGAAALWRVNGNVENIDTDFGEDFAFGVEFGVLDTAFLRVGHRFDELSSPGDYWGFGLSTRIGAFVVSADYARSSTLIYYSDDEPQSFGLSGSYRY